MSNQPIKVKGRVLSRFVADGKTVNCILNCNNPDWVVVATLRTSKSAEKLAKDLNNRLTGLA
ncbi:MAG: hypothetical protein F6K24_03070 [Okeania sp. SIO2D1]|nr:hypothetical protein [Okeania sp. SIO2D1]